MVNPLYIAAGVVAALVLSSSANAGEGGGGGGPIPPEPSPELTGVQRERAWLEWGVAAMDYVRRELDADPAWTANTRNLARAHQDAMRTYLAQSDDQLERQQPAKAVRDTVLNWGRKLGLGPEALYAMTSAPQEDLDGSAVLDQDCVDKCIRKAKLAEIGTGLTLGIVEGLLGAAGGVVDEYFGLGGAASDVAEGLKFSDDIQRVGFNRCMDNCGG